MSCKSMLVVPSSLHRSFKNTVVELFLFLVELCSILMVELINYSLLLCRVVESLYSAMCVQGDIKRRQRSEIITDNGSDNGY